MMFAHFTDTQLRLLRFALERSWNSFEELRREGTFEEAASTDWETMETDLNQEIQKRQQQGT